MHPTPVKGCLMGLLLANFSFWPFITIMTGVLVCRVIEYY